MKSKRRSNLEIFSSKLFLKFLLFIIIGYLLIALIGFFINFFIAPVSLRNSNTLLIMLLVYVILSLIIGLVVTLIISYLFTKRVLRLREKVEKMVLLNFEEDLSVSGDDELSELAQIMNNLSATLSTTISLLDVQNRELLQKMQVEKELEQERLEFIAAISHELKTPIAVIKGQTEGMLHHIGKFKNRDEYLGRNLEILENMNNLVIEMIEINRLNKLANIVNEKVNLSDLLDDQISRIIVLIEKKQQKLLKDITPNIIINGDSKFLNRAFNNILMNANKYSPEHAQIRVSLKDEDDSYLINIENTDVFIPLDDLGKLFIQFSRLEKSGNRETGGSGIGLYVVKKILDLHNFQYQIHNSKDGVCFSIKIEKDIVLEEVSKKK